MKIRTSSAICVSIACLGFQLPAKAEAQSPPKTSIYTATADQSISPNGVSALRLNRNAKLQILMGKYSPIGCQQDQSAPGCNIFPIPIVKILNRGDAVRVDRVIINKRYGDANCDLQVGKVLNMGDVWQSEGGDGNQTNDELSAVVKMMSGKGFYNYSEHCGAQAVQIDIVTGPADGDAQALQPSAPPSTANATTALNFPPSQPNPGLSRSPATPGVELMAIERTHTMPPYPALSQRLGEQGTSGLRVSIDVNGRVVGVSVIKSSGSDSLDQAAVEWVKANYRWQPPTQNGRPVVAVTEVDITWDPRNAR